MSLSRVVGAALLLGLTGSSVQAELFKDGDRVVFYGDSITHKGMYLYDVYDYYLTRFPTAKIRFFNAGVSGDNAGAAQDRFKGDVVDRHPTQVVVMFGMNDVNPGNYATNRTPGKIKSGAKALQQYQENLAAIFDRVEKECKGAKAVFVTPTPYDDRVQLPPAKKPNAFGCRDGLGVAAGCVRAFHQAKGGTLVDFYTPMVAYNRKRQKTDPTFTLIGPDRVHPQEPGHLYMAWRFLMAQGADALVSDVTINAHELVCAKSLNASVSDLKKSDDGKISFDVLEGALPFPVDPAAKAFAAEIPLEDELNQEILTVAGLPEGEYMLTIDGEEVARHTAKEWSDGINLAMNEKTPQYRQAQAVHAKGRECQAVELITRHWAASRWFMKKCKVDVEDEAQVQAYVDSIKDKKWHHYYETAILDYYVKEWPTREKRYAEIERLTQELFALRVPKSHRYTLSRTETATAVTPGAEAFRVGERPLIVSHRGSRREVEDNAAEGFAQCLAAGVRGFETDIRLTKDNELVIMHDRDVGRTTKGTGDIHAMTLAEVTALELKRSGFKVPSAQTLMDVFKGRKDVRVEFEMKENTKSLGKERGEIYCRKLHDMAVRSMEPGTYVFTSFSTETLTTMKTLFPDAPIGYITGKPCTKDQVDQAVALKACGIAPGLKGTTKEMVDYAHEKGLAVSLWMAQDEKTYLQARELGADTTTSDWPMKLLQQTTKK